MKILHYINCFFYLITITPYVTIYYFFFGMYAQFILGIVQILIAIILLLYMKRHSEIIKKHISSYWVFTLINLLIILILYKTNVMNDDIIQITFVFVTPMLIASYFIYITYLIQKQ